jgi:D-alanyl-lipoteichoic acid acyltransferase DltB (MBOAT superfamily)
VSSWADYAIGLALGRSHGTIRRKTLLYLSIAINSGLLGFFKYFNFFIEGFADLLSLFGLQANLPTLRIMLPVGISFYTFQTLSYTIDIYRGQVKPTRDPIAFLSFVSFFPQLVAGPIERARDLLPQFLVHRTFDMLAARDGLRRILWGLFKKVAIADTCAPIVDTIFGLDPSQASGTTLFFGAFFFAFQIYGDFSGYSDIAIGTARLFGFKLSQNFAYPYFARSISEFWRRWHISLSTWFRDYVYIPLGGWRDRMGRTRNILITFAVSGLWHGANWTFLGWGVLHGLYHLPAVYSDSRASREKAELKDLPTIIRTFLLVTVAWVFFRASTLAAAVAHLRYMVANAAQHPGSVLLYLWRSEMLLIVILLWAEWRHRDKAHALEHLAQRAPIRWAVYFLLVITILLNLDLRNAHEFIYFRF